MYKVCHGPHPPQCARAPTGSFAWRGGRTSLATRLSSTSSRACVVSGFRHEVRHSTPVPWCNDATARRRWPLGLFQRARGTGCGVQAVGTLAKCAACTRHVPFLPPDAGWTTDASCRCRIPSLPGRCRGGVVRHDVSGTLQPSSKWTATGPFGASKRRRSASTNGRSSWCDPPPPSSLGA